jgi:N-acetylmuramic acid 6-phosphate (MurNAc-6-P) etherase
MKTTDDVKKTLITIASFTQEHPRADISGLLQDIIIHYIQKEKDIVKIITFFGKIYDELYYDIIFQNIKVEKRVARLLENLAGPSYSKTENQRKEFLEKTTKMK